MACPSSLSKATHYNDNDDEEENEEDDYYSSFQPNNDLKLMQGLSIKSLKHHVALQPLAVIMGVGIAFVAAYIGRLASKTTDVNWTKAKDLGDHMGYYKARSRKISLSKLKDQ